jgi:hypothetical protein
LLARYHIWTRFPGGEGLILFFTSASPSRLKYTSVLDVPKGWIASPSSKNPVVPLTVALKQRNTANLKSFFERVSNPRDSMYGKYKSLAEIHEMIAPQTKVGAKKKKKEQKKKKKLK